MPARYRSMAIWALLGAAGCVAAPAHRPVMPAAAPQDLHSEAGRSASHSSENASSENHAAAARDAAAADIAPAAYYQQEKAEDAPSTAEPATAAPMILEATPQAESGVQSVSLAAILALAESQNPGLAAARERINEGYARVSRAEALWLPSLRAGVNFNHHEGAIQDVAGTVFNTSRRSVYSGLGAGAVGAGSPAVPGIVAQFHLSDAIFQPRIAEHQAASRQFGAAAARNDLLRDAAVAYLELVRAEQGLAIGQEAEEMTARLAEITEKYASAGQGLQSDRERLQAELALREGQLAAQQEEVQTASAQLAQILHASPTILLTSDEPAVAPLELLSADEPVESLVALGLSRRPELCEQKRLVHEAIERLNRESYAPLIPSVLLGMSYGGLSGRIGGAADNTDDRWDADAMAYWELRNLGLGDRAAQREMSSAARQAQFREVALLDRVAREVAQAHAQVAQRRKRIEIAQKGVEAALRSYELNLKRIENAQGLPIETLQSIQALATARRAYLDAVVDFNIAQVELCRAVGWSITEAPES